MLQVLGFVVAGLLILASTQIYSEFSSTVGDNLGTADIVNQSTDTDTHYEDTTYSTAVSLNYTNPLVAENVNATSALINDPITTVTIPLKKTGSPTGTADIGVFRTSTSSVQGPTYHMQDEVESANKNLNQRIAVNIAAYVSPGSTGTLSASWQAMMDAKALYPNVAANIIINPNSGPGAAINTNGNYTNAIQRANNAGFAVIGYVYTDYGARAQADIITDVGKYFTWYNHLASDGNGIDGVFLDEMVNNGTSVDYYRNITRTIKNLYGSDLVVQGNPGAPTIPAYIGTVDQIMFAETNGSIPSNSQLTGWYQNYDKRNFVYSAYAVSSLNTTRLAETTDYVSGFYVTSGLFGDPGGPWKTIPSYLNSEFQVANSVSPGGADESRDGLFELVGPSSSLIGDSINRIILPLKKTGSPTGNYTVGVFYTNTTIKSQFATGIANDLTTSFVDYTFNKQTPQVGATHYSVTGTGASRLVGGGGAGTTIWAEYANTGSTLIGDTFNKITVRLSEEGTTTGSITFGVWNSTAGLKRAFGTMPVSQITSADDYSLRFTTPYTIVEGDRIGFSYTGGSIATDGVRAYEDTTALGAAYDGTTTFRQRWDGATWQQNTATDATMRLELITFDTSNYTVQSGDLIGIYYSKGDESNYITTKVDSTNIFDGSNSRYAQETNMLTNNTSTDLSMSIADSTQTVTDYSSTITQAKSFGTLDVSTLTTSYTNQTFTSTAYTVQQGDYIGVRYNQTGNGTVEVRIDSNASDPFDGTASKYAEYDNYNGNWTHTANNDVAMTLQHVETITTVTEGTGSEDAQNAFDTVNENVYLILNISGYGLVLMGVMVLLYERRPF